MVRWVAGSILHGVDLLSYFSFLPVQHDWCTKGRGMCYPVCWMVHIKESLLLIEKSSPCGGSGFPLLLSEWSFTICLMPYNRKIKCVECIVKSNISFLPTKILLDCIFVCAEISLKNKFIHLPTLIQLLDHSFAKSFIHLFIPEVATEYIGQCVPDSQMLVWKVNE